MPPDGEFSTVSSNASVDEPPPSSAIPRTAPRRWSVCASSKFVIPTEYPLTPVGGDEKHTAVCTLTDRAPRAARDELRS